MKKRILVVDDTKDIRETLKQVLENKGYLVETCQNGQEALTRIEDPNPPRIDLILTDWEMPIIKGTTLSAIAYDLGVPAILMSAKEEPINHKALKFLRKPFKLAEMYQAISNLT